MALRKSKMVLCIAVYVLVMLLFAEAQYAVARQMIVANSGENITLRCNTGTRYSTYIYWVKDNQYYIVAVNEGNPEGVFYDDFPFTQSYKTGISYGVFELYIYDARAESAIYACRDGNIPIQEYDVRVIGCPNCFVNSSASHGLEQPRMDVNCHLNIFHRTERIQLNITMNRNRTYPAIIKGNSLTFNIPITYGTIQVEFNPFTDTRSNITCIVPAQLTTAQIYTSPSTSLITTSSKTSTSKTETAGTKPYDSTPKSSSSPVMDTSHLTFGTTTSPSTPSITISTKSSSTTSAKTSATKAATTSETTSEAITKSGIKAYDSTPKSSSSPNLDTESSYLTVGTVTSNQMRNNLNTGTGNNTKTIGITIIIIAIIVAILMIVVVVIIVFLRLKKRRDQQQGRLNEGEINVTVREQDTCYESIGGSSGIRDGELVNNVLYESSDEIIQNSILRSGDDQLDTALYTIPDKTGIIKRVGKSGVASVSSHGNSSMNRHQHEQKELKQEGAGDGDDTNIPLYAMPNKGPRSTMKPKKTSPGSVSTEDGADIPLYALPDKRPGSKGNITKTTPGPGTRNEGDEIPLYAVLNKEPGSKDNRPTVKPKPGGQSEALNKDDTHHEEALYAEVDKSD